MIDKFFHKLGFNKTSQFVYAKQYHKHNNYEIKINLKEGKIYYRNDNEITVERKKDGKIQLGDKTSSHFNPKQSVNEQESFVVLEAVDALLEKGYEPHDLHIERRWKLGHGASGGKADINVYKNDKTFIIIECKTSGNEFEKGKKKMLTNGGQLFSYLNQDANAEYLVLYASYYEQEDDEIVRENLIVKIKDNPDKVKQCKETDKKAVCSYKEAKNKDDFFSIWKKLYGNYFYRYGIFENDVSAYSVELKPLKKKDLKPLATSKGLFNKFAEILRHNNISDNANAFNKMLSLILCKIVDEDEKRPDDVLDFQIIEGLNDEKHIDKFQRLYKDGMAKFLGIKDFVYHSDEEIENRIKDFPKRTPLEEILQFFKDIKYYTDKTFAFKEVYNQKLFKENALILKEVVELIQFYQFKNTRKNQILGDFFELLLNHGVKQSEGQFFTPLPIAKFMVQAVDFEGLQAEKEQINPDYPLLKTLDYACGAGHFLIEAIDKIEEINQKKNLGFDVDIWTKQYIFGIEKDYRLARTSKIACFLNGDGEANIIYGDGLKKHDQLEEKYQKFDLILTNPPYSVKQFKNYVELNPADYELFDQLSEKAGEIEVLFIERAKQALRFGGRIAIILPSSILSNTGIYTKAREIILKYFEIKAVTELGSKTFIATGTNTVILFLQRREDKYPIDYQRVANEIFDEYKFFDNDYIRSKELLDAYITYRELPDYQDFLQNNNISDALAKTEMFETYKDWFDNLTEIKGKNGLKSKKWFKELPPDEQNAELNKRYIEKIKHLEKEKFYYFLLTYGQQTVVVKSPTGTAEQKNFLGYEFNKKRGFEGIEIYTDANGKPTTQLYDAEADNPAKADYYVRRAFNGENFEIDEQAQSFVKQVALTDMLDFDKTAFEKIINTNAEQKIKIQSKWPLVKLGEVCLIRKGTSITKGKVLQGKIPVVAGGMDIAYYHNKSNRDKNVITISASGANAGYVNFWTEKIFASDCSTIESDDYILTKYVYIFLKKHQNILYNLARGQAQPHVYPNDIKRLKIPLPPKEVQEKIVSEIEVLENRSKSLSDTIAEKEKAIKVIVEEVFQKYKLEKISNILSLEYGKSLPEKKRIHGNYPVYGSNGIVGYHNEFLIKAPAVIVGRKGSSGKVNLSRLNCFPIDTTYYVKTIKNDHIVYLYHLLKFLEDDFVKLSKGSGVPGLNRNDVYKYKIPVPPLSTQEKIVDQITAIEQEINRLKTELENIKVEKQNVLHKYLT